MSAPQLTTIDQALLRLTFLKYVSDAVRAADKDARAAAAEMLRKGDTLAVRSPLDDAKLARISMSDPKPVARVTDPAALDDWIREHHADKLRTEDTIVGTPAEVAAVLRHHAPELLATTTVVPGWLVNQIITLSQGAGEPVGPEGECGEQAPPGVEITTPDGVLSVTTDKTHGAAAFRALWDVSKFGMDGTVIEIPRGEA